MFARQPPDRESHVTDGDTPQRPSTAEPEQDPRRWYALSLLCLAFFMVVLGSTSVFTAAPSIAQDLGFTTAGVQWVFTIYALAFGGILLFGGRLADLFGRRRIFMAGVALFILASLMCGFAWSPGVLIAARAVQGASAAVMSPAALSLVVNAFQNASERNKALGAWSSIGGVGATAGLLVGGLVTGGLGWQWVFFINVPVGVAMLALSPVLLKESADPGRRRSLDPAGTIAITGAMMLLVYAVTQAPQAGWASAQTIWLLIGAVVLVAVFCLIEARITAPLLPLRMFRSRTLVGGNLVMIAAGMAVDGMLFTLTLYTQQVLNYSAIHFGLVMTVMTITSVAGSYLAQRAVTKVGFRPVAAAGMVFLAVSCLLLSNIAVNGTFLGDLFLPLLIFGLGMGASFVAGSIASLSGVAPADSGVAAGLQNTSFNIGTALGVAILSTVAATHTGNLLAGPDKPSTPVALTEGYESGFVAALVIVVLGLVASLTILGRRDRSPDVAVSTSAGN
jgi:EmrB/QacA subfamily drug resistance transporter